MDATEHVKKDLVHFFRTYKAHTLSMHVGPLETHFEATTLSGKMPCKQRLTPW